MDLADRSGIHKIFDSFRPDIVALCGGVTDVDLCEEKSRLAEEVNIKGTANIVEKAKEYEAGLVYVSTDYVFDGENGPYSEEDDPCPINIYGRTKLEAENIVKEKMKKYLIVRTAQLYGWDYGDKNFVPKVIKNMRYSKKIYAADDLYSTPTYSGSLSDIIINLIESDEDGVYNGTGGEFINRYDYVNKIADVFVLNKSLIQRVKLKDLKLVAKRPKKGGLKIDKIKKETSISPYECEKGLKLFKKEMST